MRTSENSVYCSPVIADVPESSSGRNPLKTRRCRIKFSTTWRIFRSPLILLLAVVNLFFGCDIFDKDRTSHPNEGGIEMMVDWSKTANQPPAVYRARVIATSGATRDFNNLSGAQNLLLVSPGEAVLYVYNEAEHVSVAGNKARVSQAQNPGMFYSYSSRIVTERDRDISHTAVMNQQTGELKISLAIKPADIIPKVKSIHATLEGVASELDMQTNELSVPSVVRTTFSHSGFYATVTFRLFGFGQSAKPNLTLGIELENGTNASVTADLSSFVANFNQSKNTLLALNAILQISNEHNPVATLDKWEQNAEMRYLSAFPLAIQMKPDIASDVIYIATDQPAWTYNIVQNGNWLTATKSDDRLQLSATANSSEQKRQATIQIAAGGLTETVTITQDERASGKYVDKEVIKLQSATIGKGIDIILMGDGYTVKDMDKGSGKYEKDMREAANYFFSVYPYTEFRNYFNVYMIAAISNQEGTSDKSTNTWVDTKFETVWEGGRSTGIECNDEIVVEYLEAIDALEFADIDDLTVIMPINSKIYAGTCNMYYYDSFPYDFANGFSICMCPVGSYFMDVIIHESCGHGFAKLMDEYVYYSDKPIPFSDKLLINTLKKYGWYENVDFYSDIMLTSWKGFANLPKYSMVGTFEGGYMYGKGIWRPELNSCMNNNVPYYNAPSRWAMVKRIMRLAGINYSFAQFLQDDKIPVYPTSLRRQDPKTFIPFAPPVIKALKK